jgi:hypothetical protein
VLARIESASAQKEAPELVLAANCEDCYCVVAAAAASAGAKRLSRSVPLCVWRQTFDTIQVDSLAEETRQRFGHVRTAETKNVLVMACILHGRGKNRPSKDIRESFLSLSSQVTMG